MNAFARGCQSSAPAISSAAFPLASTWQSAAPEHLIETPLATRDDVRRQLVVRYSHEQAEVVSAIESALAEGKCVCWMRNTVADALAAHALFSHKLTPEKLTLFHARFALRDRLHTERKILALFGKNSTPLRRRGRLVIATQVAEQSLDADWDMVVSDLAPIDRLLQRAGRLLRHTRDASGRRLRESGARDQRGEPCLWVLAPDWSDDPPANWYRVAFPKAAFVYPHHGQLWLSAKALQLERFDLPDDARSLIEGVFGEQAEVPSGLQANADKTQGQGYADASIAQQNTLKLATGYERGGIDWWSEAQTPSRLGDASMNVLLARWDGNQLRPWVDGRHGWAYSALRVAQRLVARICHACGQTHAGLVVVVKLRLEVERDALFGTRNGKT